VGIGVRNTRTHAQPTSRSSACPPGPRPSHTPQIPALKFHAMSPLPHSNCHQCRRAADAHDTAPGTVGGARTVHPARQAGGRAVTHACNLQCNNCGRSCPRIAETAICPTGAADAPPYFRTAPRPAFDLPPNAYDVATTSLPVCMPLTAPFHYTAGPGPTSLAMPASGNHTGAQK